MFPLQIRKLKLQLEEERQKCSRGDGSAAGDLAGLQNGSDLQFIEMQSRCCAGPSGSVCGLCPGSGIVAHVSQEELLQRLGSPQLVQKSSLSE